MSLNDRLRLLAMVGMVLITILLAEWLYLVPQQAPSALVDGLTDKNGDATQAFDERVRKSFPVGSAASDVMWRLAQQGFTPLARSPDGRAFAMVRRSDNLVCDVATYVRWRTSGIGHLQSIRGQYAVERCF